MTPVRRWARCDTCGARVMLPRTLAEDPLVNPWSCMACTGLSPEELMEEAALDREEHEAQLQQESDEAFLEEQRQEMMR